MNKKTASFQENIRYTFIVYSLVPAFIIACVGLFVFGFVWRYTIVQYNKNQNHEVCQEFCKVADYYYDLADEIADLLYGISGNEFSDTLKAALYEKAYKLGRDSGCQGNLYILDGNQRVLFSFGDTIPKFLVNPEYRHWGILRGISEQPQETIFQLQEGTLFIGRAVSDKEFVIFTIPQENLREHLNIRNQQVIITNLSGWIYLESSSDMEDNLGRLHKDIRQRNGFLQYNGNQYYVNSTTLSDKEMCVYTISDIDMQTNILLLIVVIIVVIFIGIGTIAYYSTGKMAAKYTHDIDEIARAFEKIQKGELDVTLNIGSSTEFQSIGKDFNIMLDSLKKQIAQNNELAEHVAFAQVKQLESQFNPHFLFNTLDNIRFMTKIDIAAADKMIVSLSRLLRYSIRDAREELTVKEDFDNLQSYLNILQIRFNKRFSYEIDIEDKIMQCLIPKLLIQPLLENAVKYGFVGREKLHVSIKGYEEGGKLIFICQDDGAGIEEELLEEIRGQLSMEKNTSTHLGLYNIHRRIRLMYKEDYGMQVESRQNEGVTVRLLLPYKTQE